MSQGDTPNKNKCHKMMHAQDLNPTGSLRDLQGLELPEIRVRQHCTEKINSVLISFSILHSALC